MIPPSFDGTPVRGTFTPNAVFLLGDDQFELIYGEECRQEIGARTNLLARSPQVSSSGTWPRLISEAEIVFTGWGGPRFDATLLDQLPHLKMVFHGAGAVRPYVTEEFWHRGIGITSAAAVNAVPVAEYTLAMIILALKRAWILNRKARRERSYRWSPGMAPGLRNATVGLVSLGLIGRQVLKLLRGFDVQVIAYDPHLGPERFAELGVVPVSLTDLMSRSDVISLHTPLTSETRGLITGGLLGLLKSGATFINTARGGIVCEAELIAFLRERPDVQAILDVTWPEPPPPDSPLYDMENVFLTPHIAGSMGVECRRLGRAMIDELDRYIRGEPLLHTIDREKAERQT